MKSIFCLFLVGLISACGSSQSDLAQTPDAAAAGPDTGSSDASGPPLKGAADASSAGSGCEQAAALCDKLATCAPFYLAAVYGDQASCADRMT